MEGVEPGTKSATTTFDQNKPIDNSYLFDYQTQRLDTKTQSGSVRQLSDA